MGSRLSLLGEGALWTVILFPIRFALRTHYTPHRYRTLFMIHRLIALPDQHVLIQIRFLLTHLPITSCDYPCVVHAPKLLHGIEALTASWWYMHCGLELQRIWRRIKRSSPKLLDVISWHVTRDALRTIAS